VDKQIERNGVYSFGKILVTLLIRVRWFFKSMPQIYILRVVGRILDGFKTKMNWH